MCGIGTDWLKHAAEAGQLPMEDLRLPTRQALVIFVKNPVLGKVKTRLAKAIGDAAALAAYEQMLSAVRSVATQVEADRWVLYSDFMAEGDAWERPVFQKALQKGNDVGERMLNAFQELFAFGYEQVVLIGSDFLDLQVHHVNHGFRGLKMNDFVLGPAADGGYYLIGMKSPTPGLFQKRQWSHSSVFADALADIQKADMTVAILPELNDIDEAADWFTALERWKKRQLAT